MIKNITYIKTFSNWLLEIQETQDVPMSRLNKLTEKIPLIMAMFVSSMIVGISTYKSFPIDNEFLRLPTAIIGGLAFDIILTSTVFSKRKNKFSILTILSALIAGLLISLDLYMDLGLLWLHSLYIVMSTLYALHSATTRVDKVVYKIKCNVESSGSSWKCSRCSSSLASKQAYGSSKRLGYCKNCK